MRQIRTVAHSAFVLGILIAIATPSASAQYLQETGVPTFAVTEGAPSGVVNVANGNLHIEIPLAATPGRSGSVVAKMVYDSRIFKILDTGGSQSWQPTNVPGAHSEEMAGWRFEITGGTNAVYDTTIGGTCVSGTDTWTWYDYQNYRYYETNSTARRFPLFYESSTPCHTGATANSSGPSLDATGYQMNISSQTPQNVIAPDGTQVYVYDLSTHASWKDTNGNYLTQYGGGDVVDTLNRTVVARTDMGSGEIDYTVLNSQGSSTYKFYFDANITMNTNFGASGVSEYNTGFYGPFQIGLSKIQLPDGSYYHFAYSDCDGGTYCYGLLSAMNLPTSSSVWLSTKDNTFTYTNFTDAQGKRQRWLNTVSTTVGGTTGTTTYTPATCGTNCDKVTVTRASGDETVYTFTLNSAGAWNTQTKAYAGSASSGTLLSTVAMDYDTSLTNPVTGGVAFVRRTRVTGTIPGASGDLTRKTETDTDTFTYTYKGINKTGSRGNATATREYGYGTGGSAGSLMRQHAFTYLHDSDSNYLSRNIVNRVTDAQTKDASGTKIAEALTTYDSASLTSVTGKTHHDDTNFGTSFTYRGNPTVTKAWTGSGSSTTCTDLNYVCSTMAYDTLGHLTSTADANSNSTTYSYTDSFYTDNGSNPPSTYTPGTATNAFVTSTTVPILGASTTSYYWGSSKTAIATDTNSKTAYSHYSDAMDRPTNITMPNGGTSNNTYPDSATASNSTTVSGSTTLDTSVHVDLAGRVSTRTITDPDGDETITYTYDASGRVSNVTNPKRSGSSPTDGSTSYAYDGMGRVITVTEQDGSARHTYYGATVGSNGGITTQLCSTSTYGVGYPTLNKNEAGKKRQTWVDAFGRVVEADEPDSSGSLTLGTCYKYDVLGHLAEVDQGSQTRTWVYDGLGRLAQQTTPEGGTVHVYYTTSGGALCAGNPFARCRVTDARSITTTYSYDALNRATGISFSNSDPSIAYYYDQTSCSSFSGFSITNGKGRRTCMTDGSGASAWSYDSEGHILTEKRTIGSVTKAISYTYTTGGLVSSITYPSGFQVTNHYNAVGRPTQVSAATGLDCWPGMRAFATSATYAPQGALASVTLGNCNTFPGIALSNTYNSRLQNVNMTATRSSDSVKLLDYTYSFVSSSINDGLVKSVTNNLSSGRSQSYTYDEMDRLATAQSSATSGTDCWGLSYSYDRYANLTAESVTKCTGPTLSLSVSTSTNQITNTGFTYDNAGNLTGDGTNSYTWNAAGLMASAAGVSYTYDGNGQRTEKSSGKLYWYGEGGQLLAESDSSGNITCEYVFFAGTRIARRDVSSGNVYYFLGDQLGNARVFTDSSGTIVEASDYYPYGQERVVSGSGTANNYKYTGNERDAESGLDHTQYRQLSSALGRWLSPDVARGRTRLPQGWNRYAYVGGSPLGRVDPSGQHWECTGPSDDFNCEWIPDGPCEDAGCNQDPTCTYCAPPPAPNVCPGNYPIRGPDGLCYAPVSTEPVAAAANTRDLTVGAIARALDALNNEKCRALFDGNLPDPREVLEDIEGSFTMDSKSKYGEIQFGYIEPNPDTGALRGASTEAISADPVFEGTRPTWPVLITINTDMASQYNHQNSVADDTFRAVTIIHELGHLYNIYFLGKTEGSASQMKDDHESGSADNQRAVMDACF